MFDPNDTGVANGNYFGFPFTPDEAQLVILSVPWDATSSYGGGASLAPEAIIAASPQLDFYDPAAPGAWRKGIATLPVDPSIQTLNTLARADAIRVMRTLEHGQIPDKALVSAVNDASTIINDKVYVCAREWLTRDKSVALVGGDHSTPYGLVRAIGEKHPGLSILHIDAHADLRDAYEGFTHSHASIMFNILRDVPAVDTLVQVGVRDQSEAEKQRALDDPRIHQFEDWHLASAAFRGATWHDQCAGIIAPLGNEVYVSFDVDGLDPALSPHTGTPVPGGVSFNRAVYLLHAVAASGRRIVGFDLCETAPSALDEWDANVAARVLFKLSGLCLL